MNETTSESHVGIWIDTKQAKIIHVNGAKNNINVILSDIETKEREEGETGNQGRMGNQFLDPEKQRHNKLEEQSKVFLKRVIDSIKKDKSFVIFGPSNMKLQLEKEIKKHPDLRSKIDSVKTADSMTDNQLAAWIRNFYSK